MRLLMKGGGCKSKRHRQEPFAKGRGSISTVQPENNKSGVVASQRRSRRLNLKRPREAREYCMKSKKESCPLCNEELPVGKNSFEELISCFICGRQFHIACSGIQEGWAGHWNLECRHHELDCCPVRLRSHSRKIVKKTTRQPFDCEDT